MTYICFRIDIDYVPWDSPDAQEFGHGEPAILLRLFELASKMGPKLHFFASTRTLSAFRSAIATILEEGHDLDWLCKRPDELESRYKRAETAISQQNHSFEGFALKEDWNKKFTNVPDVFHFISSKNNLAPKEIFLYPVKTTSDREAMRAGLTPQAWTDELKLQMRDAASRRGGLTICVRPQVLYRFDPNLAKIKELMMFAEAVGLPIRSLREVDSKRAKL